MQGPSVISIWVVIVSIMIVPLYIAKTFSRNVAIVMNVVVLVWGGIVCALTYYEVELSTWVVPCVWALAVLSALVFRKFLVVGSQKWLVGLQAVRVIGAIFLIEMVRQRIPSSFALPAGLGDLVVGTVAIAAILVSLNKKDVPKGWVLAVLVLGLLDFAVALFFGMRASKRPSSKLLTFPTGVIPLLLAPFALFIHVVSALNLRG